MDKDNKPRLTIAEMKEAARREQVKQWLIAAGSGLTTLTILAATTWLLFTAISGRPAASPSPPLALPPTHTAITTPVMTITITPLLTPTVSPSSRLSTPAADCAADNLYQLNIAGPVLDPAPGSVADSTDEPVRAVWRVKNSGQCPWKDIRLFLVSTGIKPPPLPPIEPAGRVAVGAAVTVTLSVPAADLFERNQLNWVWAIQVKKAVGQVWYNPPSQLQLVLDQPWVIPAQPLLTPVLPSPSQTVPSPSLPPVELISPAEGETFVGAAADLTFKWTALARPLASDEYYVLIIEHQAGPWAYWTQATEYTTPHAPDNNLSWLMDYGPELIWRVGVARSDSPEGLPGAGQLVSPYSSARHFRWINPAFSNRSNQSPAQEPDSSIP